MSKDTVLTDHVTFMRLSGQSPCTIDGRRRVLRDLAAFAGRPLLRLGHDDLVAWRASLRVCPDSVVTYVAHVRSFYRWACDDGRLRSNPAARVPVPRRVRRLPRPVDEPDLALALASAPPDIRLMLVLAGWLGLRCCELAWLRWESVSMHAQVLLVMGKGSKERVLSLSPWVIAELHRYGVRRSGPVFPRRDGQRGPNTPRNVSSLLTRFLRLAGITATPHQWRHRFATALLDVGANLREVQEALGHARLESTAIYTRVRPRSIAAAMAALPIPVPDELPEAA